MLTALLRRMGSRKSYTAWSSHLMQMPVLPSQSTARLRKSLLVAWQCKSWACGHVEGHRSCQEMSLSTSLINHPWGQCCHRWWRGKSLILLFCFIYSDSFDYYFNFLPPYSQYPLLFPFQFGFFLGCGETVLCARKERNFQLYALSARCSMKVKKQPPFLHILPVFPDHLTCWISVFPVTGASGPPRWSSVWHLHSESLWNWGPPTAVFGINDHPVTGCCEMAIGRIYCLKLCLCGSCQVHILAPG